MKPRAILIAAALAGGLAASSAASSAEAATFTFTGGEAYALPADFGLPPMLPDGYATGAPVLRNGTLGLDGPGRVTFTYFGSEAAYDNSLWTGKLALFNNQTSVAGDAATVDFGAGALPFDFQTVSLGQRVANGASQGYFGLAFYRLGDASVFALFNDSATGDRDYDDLVVRLDVAPIPLPAAAWLLLAALGGLGLVKRRRAAAQ